MMVSEKEKRMRFDADFNKSLKLEEVRRKDSLLLFELASKQEQVRRLNALQDIAFRKIKINEKLQTFQENLHLETRQLLDDVRSRLLTSRNRRDDRS